MPTPTAHTASSQAGAPRRSDRASARATTSASTFYSTYFDLFHLAAATATALPHGWRVPNRQLPADHPTLLLRDQLVRGVNDPIAGG